MATKKENGNPGIPILLKRTDFVYADSRIDAEGLKFGEPLFNSDDYTLTVGDGSSTKVSEMKIFQAMDRARAKLYDSLDTGKLAYLNNADLSKFEWLNNINQKNLDSMMKVWDNHFDSADSIGTIWLDDYMVNSTWYTLDNDNMPTDQEAVTAPCGKKIDIEGMKDTLHPHLTRHPHGFKDAQLTNDQMQAYGCITGGVSGEGYMILYCTIKKPTSSFYIDLIGG